MTDSKKMWELYPDIWKTEAAFMSWIRGGIRKAMWNRHPVKITFMNNNRIKIPNPNPKGKVKEVWGAKCALTGELVPIGKADVDHKVGGHPLKTMEDIDSFIKGIVLVTEDDLQFVTREAHKIKSYAERMGITFEEAKVIKEAIAITKQPVKKVVEYCKQHGYTDCSNPAKRRAAVTNILKEKYNVE